MRPFFPFLSSILLLACSPQGEPDVTWYGEVEPIVATRCATCHQPGSIGGFLDLTDPDAAVQWSAVIDHAVRSGAMPPFPAADGDCSPTGGFENDPRLTPEEKATLLAWTSAGSPLGEPTSSRPPIPDDSLDPISVTLRAPAEVRVPPSSEVSDRFVCLLLDPELDDTVWLDGFEVLPDDAEVTHHVVIQRADRAEAMARDLQDGDADGQYDCFSGVDIPQSSLVGGWVPGAGPMRYPEDSGVALAPDEVLIAQMHYHGLEQERFDRTEIAVHWLDSPPQSPAVVRLLGNARNEDQGLLPGPADDGAPEFRIPAGAATHLEASAHFSPVARPTRPFMVVPHMHLVGTRITTWIEHEDGSRDCLVDVPRYDFDWQLVYRLDPDEVSRTVSENDAIVVECEYDNRLENPTLAAALRDAGLEAPVDVGLGNGTLDEMCLVGVGAVPL